MSYRIGDRTVYRVGENRENFRVKTLAEGEVQDYKILKAAAKASGQPFIDLEFDCDKHDILGTWKGMPEKIVWKRPKEIKEGAVFSKIGKTGKRYSYTDITQGTLGNCYYLTALGLVTGHKNLADFVIPEDNSVDQECGIYHFRYWVRGYYFDIVVDDRIPCTDEGEETYFFDGYVSQYRPVAAVPMGNEFWPVLVEKAYAKLYGSYGRTCSGSIAESTEDFTGGFIEEIPLNKCRDLLTSLQPRKQFGVLFGFGTPSQAVSGLIGGHAYAALQLEIVVDLEGKDVWLIRMHNPWGHDEWTGDWSDSPRSPKWDTLTAFDRERLLTVKDEGEFWMSYEDATNPRYFRIARFCYYYNDLDLDLIDDEKRWQRVDYHGEWKGESAQPTVKDAEFAKKPQYLVKIQSEDTGKEKKGAGVIVALLWKDYLDKPLESPDIAFVKLYEIKDKDLISQGPPYTGEQLSDKSKMDDCRFQSQLDFSSRLEFCVGMQLEDGAYLFIPYIFSKRVVEGSYVFRFLAAPECEFIGLGGSQKIKPLGKPTNLPQYDDFLGNNKAID